MQTTTSSSKRACVTGICLIDVVKTLRIHRESAEDLLPTELRGYLEIEIRPTGNYPETDFIILLRTLARINTYCGVDVYHDLGKVKASKDLQEVFPEELVQGDPWANLERFEWIWHLYHDTGHLRLERLGASEARLELRAYDGACEEIARLTAGYLEEMLRLASANEPRVEVLEAASPAAWRITWTLDAT